MTEGADVSQRAGRAVSVRGYVSSDYPACRGLWVELTEHHRRIYEDDSIGGDDPGSGFDSYLAVPERVVADALARGHEYLAVRPVARNADAIRRFYGVGFRTLGGHVDLTMDLAAGRQRWLDGQHVHGLRFKY